MLPSASSVAHADPLRSRRAQPANISTSKPNPPPVSADARSGAHLSDHAASRPGSDASLSPEHSTCSFPPPPRSYSRSSSPEDVRSRPGSPFICPPPWAPASAKPIRSPACFKSDPACSTNYTQGWLTSHEPVKARLYAKGKRVSARPTLWTRLGGGLEAINTELASESLILAAVTGLAVMVRCWKIWRPSSVVFDEVHFGGFASKYIRSSFFMDVHPPLAKLLIALVGLLSGYDGRFDFKDIGNDYSPDRVPYVRMRLLPALLGVAVVPLSYLTMRMFGLRPHSALLGATLIMLENGMIVQSRFILLDSPLLFFTALSIFFHTGFCNEDAKRQFTRRWWIWLVLTGLSLGAVVSSKWIGLFTIATTGLVTVSQLWNLLGDLRVPVPLLARSFVARFICLAVVPLLFYMFMFQIHFWVLSSSGDGDAFMSSEFQQTLRGHWMPDTFADVLIGSNISIKHTNTLGGYLHSHPHPYPAGSHQQQVTLYPHADENNLWTVLGRLIDDTDIRNERRIDYYHQHRTPINTTNIIRLQHAQTEKRLHTHDVRAPVTEVDYQNEVSGYGFPKFPGDANDEWIVEIVSKESDVVNDPVSATRLKALRTKFRLRHPLQNCYLFSHKVRLPDWGFGQQEVTCNKNPMLANSLWYIETSTHPLLMNDKKAIKINYRRPGFIEKFWELQQVMWQTNKGLVDRHAYDSRPASWPFLARGINFWVKDHRQVYLLGNPFVWYLGTAAIGLYGTLKLLLILRTKRGYHAESTNETVLKYDGIAGYLSLGWATHYLPFFLMTRQLFLHHYFPALYYSLFLAATVFDLATQRLGKRARWRAVGLVLLMAGWVWWVYAPLTYAGAWTRGECERARWRRSWDFSCHEFYERRAEYDEDGQGWMRKQPEGRGGTRTMVPVGMLEPIRNVFEEEPPPAQESLIEGPHGERKKADAGGLGVQLPENLYRVPERAQNWQVETEEMDRLD